jgi:hypothetical protein
VNLDLPQETLKQIRLSPPSFLSRTPFLFFEYLIFNPW